MPRERLGFVPPAVELDRLSLAERLRQAREYAGLKQTEVAAHLGIQRTALLNMEAGNRRVEVLEMAKLAKLYQLPVSWFTGEDQHAVKGQLLEEVDHIARIAGDLSRTDRQTLAKFAEFLQSRKKRGG